MPGHDVPARPVAAARVDDGVLVLDVSPASDHALARRLLVLTHAAYAVEAALLGDDRIPALHEGLEDLLRSPVSWLGAVVDGELVGALSWTDDGPEGVDVDRLVVAPHVHRRGTGSALVREVLLRARGRPTRVSTGSANRPARALYEGLGFGRTGEHEPVQGLLVTRYLHSGAPSDP